LNEKRRQRRAKRWATDPAYQEAQREYERNRRRGGQREYHRKRWERVRLALHALRLLGIEPASLTLENHDGT
jgi:hypothetical protein